MSSTASIALASNPPCSMPYSTSLSRKAAASVSSSVLRSGTYVIGILAAISSRARSVGGGNRSGLVNDEYQASSLKKLTSTSWCLIPSRPAISPAASTSRRWVCPYRTVSARKSNPCCAAWVATVVESNPPDRSTSPIRFIRPSSFATVTDHQLGCQARDTATLNAWLSPTQGRVGDTRALALVRQ